MVETKARLQTQKRALDKEIAARHRVINREINDHSKFIRKYGVNAHEMKEYSRQQEAIARESVKIDKLIEKRNVIESKLEDIERFGHVRPRR